MIPQDTPYKKKHRAMYSVEELDTFYSAFKNCDLDESGEISKEELQIVCEKANYAITDGSLEFIFKVKKSINLCSVDYR